MTTGINWQPNNKGLRMGWKPEYEKARKAREAANPKLRERRLQSAKDSQQRNKEIRKEYMKAYYLANPEKFKRITKEQREQRNAARRKAYAESAEVRAAMRAAAKAWQEGNPYKRKAQRLRQYGIEVSDFEDMMAMQNGQCAICGFSDTDNKKLFPVVDHCHKTGIVRGLLCMACNQGLGKFKDNANLLMAAAAYLSKHG